MVNRNRGIQASMTSACWKSQQVCADTLLEHQHKQSVGSADREQIHDDGLDRYDYRPEGEHQYDEAEAKNERKDDRGINVDDVEEVGRLSGYAADVDLRGNPVEGVGNVQRRGG